MEKWLLTEVLDGLNQIVNQCKPKLQPNLIANDAFLLYGKKQVWCFALQGEKRMT